MQSSLSHEGLDRHRDGYWVVKPHGLPPEHIVPSPASLRAVAAWNDRAAVRAKRKGDHKSAKRHRAQAQQLRKDARQ